MISSGDKTNPLVRVVQHVLTGIYQELGYQVIFRHCPLKRSLVEANAGAFDAEVARMKGLEETYPNLIPIPVAVYTIEGVAFAKDRSICVNDWESLRKYRTGILKGVQFAQKGTKNLNVVNAVSLKSLFKMLNAGRLDIAVEAKLNGTIMRAKMNLEDTIHVLEPPLVTTDLYHYLHKKNANLVQKLTRLMTRMQQDGSLHALIQRAERQVIAEMSTNEVSEMKGESGNTN